MAWCSQAHEASMSDAYRADVVAIVVAAQRVIANERARARRMDEAASTGVDTHRPEAAEEHEVARCELTSCNTRTHSVQRVR